MMSFRNWFIVLASFLVITTSCTSGVAAETTQAFSVCNTSETSLPPLKDSTFLAGADIAAFAVHESTFYVLTKLAEGTSVGSNERQFVLLSAEVDGASWEATSAFDAGSWITTIAIRELDDEPVLFAYDQSTRIIAAFAVAKNMTRLFNFTDFDGNTANFKGSPGVGMAGVQLVPWGEDTATPCVLVADPLRQCLRLFKTNVSQATEKYLPVVLSGLRACVEEPNVQIRTLLRPAALAARGHLVYIWDTDVRPKVIRLDTDRSEYQTITLPEEYESMGGGPLSLQAAFVPLFSQDALLFFSSTKAFFWFPGGVSPTVLWPAGQEAFGAAFLHTGVSRDGAFTATFFNNGTNTISAADIRRPCPFTVLPLPVNTTRVPPSDITIAPAHTSATSSTASVSLTTPMNFSAGALPTPGSDPPTTGPTVTLPPTVTDSSATEEPAVGNSSGSQSGASVVEQPSPAATGSVIIGVAVGLVVLILVILAVSIVALFRCKGKGKERKSDESNVQRKAEEGPHEDDAFPEMEAIDRIGDDDGIDVGTVAVEMDQLRKGSTHSTAATSSSPLATITLSTSNGTHPKDLQSEELFTAADPELNKSGAVSGDQDPSNGNEVQEQSNKQPNSDDIPAVRMLERNTTASCERHSTASSPETPKMVGRAEGNKKTSSFISAQTMIKSCAFTRLKLIGRGAFGSVYNCVLDDGQVIAMKEMLLPEDADKELTEIMAEVDLVSELAHPNVVQYYGCRYEREENKMLLFMELAAGGSLATVVRRAKTAMSEQIAQRYFRQVLEALSYIHSRGVVHRDLKCDNVLLSQDGQCKLGDFGTSRVMQNTTKGGTVIAQTLIGTPVFMPPEMILEKSDEDGVLGYTKKADIWSFGILCLEFMNRGHPPWPAFPNQGAALFHIASEKGKPFIPDGVSDEFRDFIGRCCERDPAKRATAVELLAHPWFGDESLQKGRVQGRSARNQPQ